MTVTTRSPGDVVTAAIFNTKLEAPVASSELATSAVGSTQLATGAVTALKLARQPICQLKRTTDQTALATGTSTPITWETAAINSDNMFSAGSPTRMTIQTGGLWFWRAVAAFEATATGIRRLSVRLNGTTIIGLEQVATLGAGSATTIGLSGVYPLGAGDYLEVLAYHDRGSDLLLSALTDWAPVFTGFRLCT